jgi:drug/metabolite transporter (DMT)-like permease
MSVVLGIWAALVMVMNFVFISAIGTGILSFDGSTVPIIVVIGSFLLSLFLMKSAIKTSICVKK